MSSMIQANELRIGNRIGITISNDKGIYVVGNIGGYQRIFDSKEDETLYNQPIKIQLKSKKTPQYHDEMLVGIIGGSRTGERIIESKLKPIPLTEEILLKCGFEYIEHYWRFENLSCPMYFLKHPNGKELVCFIHNCSNGTTKYLHQLQNLYFALTGTELEINV